MTEPENDRLERIERLVEEISQRVSSNTKAIEANSQAIAANRADIATALSAIERLANSQLQSAQIAERQQGAANAILGTINAALEQQGRLVDYLMRRDRHGNNDGLN